MEDEEALLQSTTNPDVQVEIEDEIQDWRNLSKVKDTALPKRGEKDYEPDGTKVQEKILDESRQSMFDALAGDRSHIVKQHVRATWISSVRRGLIEKPKGSFLQTCGVIDSQNKCWLRPEEFCYLAERGTIEPWFEDKDVAMSVEAVYPYCFENEDEIDEYHVYAYLKRHGFIVMRNDDLQNDEVEIPKGNSLISQNIFKSLYYNVISIITQSRIFKAITNLSIKLGIHGYPRFHPLHFPTTNYTSYTQIYNSIKLIPFHSVNPRLEPPKESTPQIPLTFNVWKPDPKFSKKSPPKPSFQVLVRNVNKYNFPTLKELRSLFESTNIQNQDEHEPNQAKRLKYGYRYVLIATVDYGIINMVKVSEADFGSEDVWYVPPPKGANKNNKNNHRKPGKKVKK